MSEKATLLPSVIDVSGHHNSASYYPPPPGVRLVIVPGLEFDARRRSKYGYSSLLAALLIFLSWLIIESRSCQIGPGLKLNQLQSIHIALMIFSFMMFLLSLFSIADFLFQFRITFFIGVLIMYVAAGIAIWATYQAAVSPCKSFPFPNSVVDLYPNKTNVFAAGDGFGISILLIDIFAAVLMVSSASSFYYRY